MDDDRHSGQRVVIQSTYPRRPEFWLPVEKVIYFSYFSGAEALKRWKALRPRARLSQSSIFAIYRLDFENGGIWQGDEID